MEDYKTEILNELLACFEGYSELKIYFDDKVIEFDSYFPDLYSEDFIDSFPIEDDYDFFVDFGELNFLEYIQEFPNNATLKELERILKFYNLEIVFVDFNKLILRST